MKYNNQNDRKANRNWGDSNMNNHHVQSVVSGVLVVDKPVGLTSHDVVQIIKKSSSPQDAAQKLQTKYV